MPIDKIIKKIIDKIDIKELAIETGISLAVVGVILTSSFLVNAMAPPYEIKIFQREEGKPSVIREYKPGRDRIYVKYNDKYIPMKVYLKSFPSKIERTIEETEIERAVHWHK